MKPFSVSLFGRKIIEFASISPPPERTVIGASGAALLRGVLETEYNKELRHPTGVPTYDRMKRSDHMIRKQLRAIIYPILAADWNIEAVDKEDEAQVEAAEFIAANLLQQGDQELHMKTRWRQHLREALNMLTFGFSSFEKVYRGINGKIIIDSLPYRYPASFERLQINRLGEMEGAFQKITMRSDDAPTKTTERNEVFIPRERLVWYTFEQEGIDYFGEPLLRSLYKAWKFKEMAERYNIIDLQRRAAGMPMGTLSETDGDPDRAKMVEILSHMDGSNPQDRWALLKAGQELKFMSNEARVKEALPTIEKHEKDIAGGAGGRFMDTPDTGHGSKAVVGKLSDFFFVALTAIAEEVCETVQKDLIADLMTLNFPSVKVHPVCRPTRLALDEGLALIDTLGVSVQGGLIPHWRLDDENHVRTHLRLPRITEEEAKELEEKKREEAEGMLKLETSLNPAPVGAVPGRPGGGQPRASRDPKASQRGRGGRGADRKATLPKVDVRTFASVTITPVREPERFFNEVLEMPRKLMILIGLEKAYFGAASAVVHENIRPDFIDRVRKNNITLASVGRVRARFGGRLEDDLRRIAERAHRFGNEIVAAELVRMKTEGILGTNPIPERLKKFTIAEKAADVGVGVDVAKILREEERILMEIVVRHASAGLTGDELADAVAAEYGQRVDGYLESIGRAGVTRSYNAGRDAFVARHAKEIADRAVRNEQLDQFTCANCDELHGLVVDVGSAVYYEFMPPNFCFGGENCRGEYTYFPVSEDGG